MATLDIEQTRNQARALLDSGIESVTALVKTRQRISDLKGQLAEGHPAYKTHNQHADVHT